MNRCTDVTLHVAGLILCSPIIRPHSMLGVQKCGLFLLTWSVCVCVSANGFSTAAPSVWNSLPVSVQNCDTLTLFKSRLKAHLFSSVYAS